MSHEDMDKTSLALIMLVIFIQEVIVISPIQIFHSKEDEIRKDNHTMHVENKETSGLSRKCQDVDLASNIKYISEKAKKLTQGKVEVVGVT